MMASAGDADHQAVKQEDKKTDVGMRERERERNKREEMKEKRWKREEKPHWQMITKLCHKTHSQGNSSSLSYLLFSFLEQQDKEEENKGSTCSTSRTLSLSRNCYDDSILLCTLHHYHGFFLKRRSKSKSEMGERCSCPLQEVDEGHHHEGKNDHILDF